MDLESQIFKTVSSCKATMYVPKIETYKEFDVKELQGYYSILHFYSGNFTAAVLPELKCFVDKSKSLISEEFNLVSVSIDNPSSMKAFIKLRTDQGGLFGMNNVLVADQTGAISKAFQVYDEENHRALPSYIILGKDMKIQAKLTGDHNVSLSPEPVLQMLKQLMNNKKQSDVDQSNSDDKAVKSVDV